MSGDLDQLEALAGALLQNAAPAERRRILRTAAREIAKGQRDRIKAQVQPDGTAFAPRKAKGTGKLRRKGAIRRAAMFARLRMGAHLKAGATADEAWVGFTGRTARIARVHQEGREDSPAPGQAKIRYPRRQLLGLTEADRTTLLDTVLAAVTG